MAEAQPVKFERKVLTLEEFEESQRIQRARYDTLSKYDDFQKLKHKFNFDIMSYDEFMKKYRKVYKRPGEEDDLPDEDNIDEKIIMTDSIEE